MDALIVPVVFPSRVFKEATATEVVSLIVTASFPNPIIPEEYAVSTSAMDPVIVVTVPAVTLPVVLPSIVLRVDASMEVSVKVTFSSPKPVIPAAE